MDDNRPGRAGRRWWFAGAIGACLLGVGCKEVTAVVPLLVLLFDQQLVAGSLREAWRMRRGFYAGLFATWLPLLWLIASVGGDRGGTFKFTAEAIARQWRGQCEAVLVYLKLTVWPAPLAIDYGPLHVSDTRLILCAMALAALIAATAWALRRGSFGATRSVGAAGFCGAGFFLILAPTSLMPGIVQTIVEHRMYLPLAAVLAVAVCGAFALAGPRALIAIVVLAVGEGALTVRRNADYRDDLTLWSDTVAKRPGSALAQNGLGAALFMRGKYSAAFTCYEKALRVDAQSPRTQFNAGQVLEALGRPAEALPHYTEAFRLLPHFARAHSRVGAILEGMGQPEAAEPHLRAAIADEPTLAEAHNALGLSLVDRGRFAEAVACYQEALRVSPEFADAECNWGAAAYQLGRPDEARQHLARALQLRPAFAEAHFNLGLIASASGREDEARAAYAEAVRLKPDYGEARLNLGISLAQAGRFDAALAELQAAARAMPQRAEPPANLGILLAELGRFDEAIANYEQALRLRPGYAQAHYNLGNALVQRRRLSEARAHFAEAVRLVPTFAPAREMLQRLDAAAR